MKKLPDFSSHPRWEAMRRAMGATEIVKLEKAAWEPLPERGVDIEDLTKITPLDDGTLGYQGHRVLVYIRDVSLNRRGHYYTPKYHVAECTTLREMRNKKRFGRYVATERKDGQFVVNRMNGSHGQQPTEHLMKLHVCKNCLTELNWGGDAAWDRAARTRYAETFTPEAFFEKYSSRITALPAHTDRTAPLNTYADDWASISERMRARAGWCCTDCGRDMSSRKNDLHVHHKNGEKNDNRERNLEVLCIDCHSQRPMHGFLKRSA